MPMILALLLLAVGVGWLKVEVDWNDVLPTLHADVKHDEAPPAAPELSQQDFCQRRLEDARMLLIGKGQLRDGEDLGAGHARFWQRAVVRTGDTPGGPNGVLFTVEGPSGERYGAGLSGPQPDDPVKYVSWYSFSKGDPARLSLFKDEGGRSGFVGAYDETDEASARRADFLETMQPAIDDCLSYGDEVEEK